MSSNPTDPLSDEAVIRHNRQEQNRAIAAGDLDVAARYWTPDISIRRALGDAVAGAVAARAVLEQAAKQQPPMVYQRVSATVLVADAWPLAYEEGAWSGHLHDVASAPIIAGRYSAQWVKRGSDWLIRSELFVAISAVGAGRALRAQS